MSIPLKSRNHFNFSAPNKYRFLFKQIVFEYSFKQRESLSLRGKCWNTEFFVVRIFLYSDWIQENTDQKILHSWTLFTLWWLFRSIAINPEQIIFLFHFKKTWIGFTVQTKKFLPLRRVEYPLTCLHISN